MGIKDMAMWNGYEKMGIKEMKGGVGGHVHGTLFTWV